MGQGMNAEHPETRLADAGWIIPALATPAGHYVPAREFNGLVTTSSISAKDGAEIRYRGRLGASLTMDDGCRSAELAVLNALAALKSVIGDLARVTTVMKLIGYVNSTPDFDQQHVVVNAASDLIILAFDEVGRHTRAAIGVAALPQQCSVGIEITVGVEQ